MKLSHRLCQSGVSFEKSVRDSRIGLPFAVAGRGGDEKRRREERREGEGRTIVCYAFHTNGLRASCQMEF